MFVDYYDNNIIHLYQRQDELFIFVFFPFNYPIHYYDNRATNGPFQIHTIGSL